MFTAKVTRIEDKGNVVTASIYTSEKDRDGEWQTGRNSLKRTITLKNGGMN